MSEYGLEEDWYLDTYLSDYDSAQIYYIPNVGYKLRVIANNGTEFFIALPASYDLTDFTEATEDNPITRNGVGVIPITEDDYDLYFADNPNAIEIPTTVTSLDIDAGKDIKDLANDYIQAVQQAAAANPLSELYQNTEFQQLLASYMFIYPDDAAAAFDAAVGSEAINPILEDIGMSKAMITQDKIKRTDSIAWNALLPKYKNSIINVASKTYGVDLPDDVVTELANLVRSGYMGIEEMSQQIGAMVDPGSKIIMNNAVRNILSNRTIEQTTVGQSQVEALMRKYLPKNLRTYDIADKASEIRNDASAEEDFIAEMKAKRMQWYPMYDENIAWEDILNSKIGLANSILGIQMTEDDGIIDKLIKTNDLEKENKMLREYGLENNVMKTKKDLALSIMQSFGQGVVPQQSFRG
tara:strand:- start:311 stop:1543 length:1233 start_codon:yes stop_codon:yes gene_type:complete